MRIVDQGTYKLSQLITEQGWRDAMRREVGSLGARFSSSLLPDPGLYPPEAASAFTDVFITAAEEHCRTLVPGYTAARWLWYLRRLPAFVFAGNIASTHTQTAAIADIASQESVALGQLPVRTGSVIAYGVDEHIVRRVLRFVAATKLLSQMQVLKRRVGKGSSLYVQRGASLPVGRSSPQIEAAMRLYDLRMHESKYSLYRTGTVLVDGAGEANEVAILVYRIGSARWVPAPLWRNGEPSDHEVFANFLPRLLSTTSLKALTLDSRLADKQIWRAEAALMLALSIGSVMLFSSLEHALMTVVQVGYFVCSDALFESILNDAMPEIHQKVGEVFPGVALPADGASFLRTLEQLRPSVTRSLYGSPIRRAEAALFVDLYAATQRLEHAFEFPAFQGEEGNARGDHFEDAAQAIIDASGWRPSSDLRLLRRRTLRANGKDVTDVDAVAERDGTALLISCKSKIYSESYHSGDYRSVRNIASAIEEAVGEAAHNTALLDRHRKGDNYDLTRFSRIVIPVITPITVYTPIGASTDFILDGLRASASISELSQFLQRP